MCQIVFCKTLKKDVSKVSFTCCECGEAGFVKRTANMYRKSDTSAQIKKDMQSVLNNPRNKIWSHYRKDNTP